MIEAGTSRASLRRSITRSIIVEMGLREDIAAQFADAVMAALDNRKAANGYVYVGSPRRRYDELQIEQALRSGTPVREVCRRFNISRSAIYRLFPAGLPEPSQSSTKTGTAAG